MSRLISAIQNRSNALLEATTGCGKTLALLCWALAWQAKAKKVAEAMEGAWDIRLANLAFTQGVALGLRCTLSGCTALNVTTLTWALH
jgi:hypothetical protein